MNAHEPSAETNSALRVRAVITTVLALVSARCSNRPMGAG
jgi:hypothetical protein